MTRRTCARLIPKKWMRIVRRLRQVVLPLRSCVTSGIDAAAPGHDAPPSETVSRSGRSRDESPTAMP